jgi:hypothetical protein
MKLYKQYPAQPLDQNPVEVADSSPGQASLRAPPWVSNPERLPLITKPREARILFAASTPSTLGNGRSSWCSIFSVHKKPRRKQDGFIATVEFIALLAIMVLLAIANSKALYHLHREVRVLEQQQIKRLNISETNSVAIVRIDMANAESK